MADDGTLLYVRGRHAQMSQLVWISRSGNVEGDDRREAADVPLAATLAPTADAWPSAPPRETIGICGSTTLLAEPGPASRSSRIFRTIPSGRRTESGSSTRRGPRPISRSSRAGATGRDRRTNSCRAAYFSVSPDGKYLLYILYNGKTWDLWYARRPARYSRWYHLSYCGMALRQ